jgi:hypothetical protein
VQSGQSGHIAGAVMAVPDVSSTANPASSIASKSPASIAEPVSRSPP